MTMITATIKVAKVNVLLHILRTITYGPQEGYGILIASLYKLNFELTSNPVPIDQFCSEVAQSLRSIRKGNPS